MDIVLDGKRSGLCEEGVNSVTWRDEKILFEAWNGMCRIDE